MRTSKIARRPVLRRSGAVLAAAFLVTAGAQLAGAGPSASSSGGSSESGTATATASPSRSASSTSSSTSASTTKATTTAPTSSAAGPGCPEQVVITLGRMTVSGGMVTIAFTHNAHNCPSARPALLHIHQNLLMTPQAGSDPVHQWNADLYIGPSHGDGVTVPLLESADGKCFVQVDAHASGMTRGQFFPTTTCTSPSGSSPATSSPPASSSGHTSAPPSSTTVTSTPPGSTTMTSATPSSTASTSTAHTSTSAPSTTTSRSFLPESTSRTQVSTSYVPVAQVGQSPPGGSLASTGSRTVLPIGLAALLLVTGAGLLYLGRHPRRH